MSTGFGDAPRREPRAEVACFVGRWHRLRCRGVGAVVFCEVVEKGGCELAYDDNATLKAALIVSAIGAVAGGIVGYFIKTDRWEEIPLEGLRVSLAPQPDGGFALGFSVRF